jgi:hypothetical protein
MKYGFNGQEVDKDLWGGSVVFKYRIEDARLGRFFSVDPLAPKYPWYTPYQVAGNKVINSIELEGLEDKIAIIIDDSNKALQMSHEKSLVKLNYHIIHASSGQQAIESLSKSQLGSQAPTSHLLILSHGYFGGVMGQGSMDGIYSQQFVDWIGRYSFYGGKANNGSITTTEILKMRIADKFNFTESATITLGGCNLATCKEAQEALLVDEIHPSERGGSQGIDNYYWLSQDKGKEAAESWRKINFAGELAVAFGTTVEASSPRADGKTRCYSGQSSPVNGTTRAGGRWYSFVPTALTQIFFDAYSKLPDSVKQIWYIPKTYEMPYTETKISDSNNHVITK